MQEITKVEAADDSSDTIEISTAEENDCITPVAQSGKGRIHCVVKNQK